MHRLIGDLYDSKADFKPQKSPQKFIMVADDVDDVGIPEVKRLAGIMFQKIT